MLATVLCGQSCKARREPSGGETAPNATASATLITLERQACYGSCPVYRLQLHADGRVEFSGEHFTGHCGEAEGRISPDAWASLVARFDAIGFWSLQDVYHCGYDAGPSVTSIRAGDREKRVEYDPLCGSHGELLALAAAIDEAAGARRWVDGCGLVLPTAQILSFVDGSAALPAGYESALAEAIKTLEQTPVAAGLSVFGTAYRTERDAGTLAKARADAVKAALVSRGIAATKVELDSAVASEQYLGSTPRNVSIHVKQSPCGCPGGSFGR